MPPSTSFGARLGGIVNTYLSRIATAGEHLSLLRWQLAQGDALERRDTLPGHVTTSAFILSSDLQQVLLIDHIVIGRWLQPGGHYEPAARLWHSARREAIEETGCEALTLHPWHEAMGEDLPFVIDSHDVPGKPARGEPPHVHHDFQYLFLADLAQPLTPQVEEVHAAAWKPVRLLADISPKVLRRLALVSGRAPGS